MITVASTRLASGRISPSGYGSDVVCPAGFVMIVKSLYFTSSAASPQRVACQLLAEAAAYSSFLVDLQAEPGKLVQVEGWAVLLPGDLVRMYASDGVLDYWLSGAVLYGTSNWTPPPATTREDVPVGAIGTPVS